jgi:hypothetical protein
MRKLVAIALTGGLLLASLPGMSLAGDSHAVSNRWAGVAIGTAAAVVGGVLLNALQGPASPSPATYAPPPVIYTPAPPVVYATPAVVYAPAPVIVQYGWTPRGHWERELYEHGRSWKHR